MTLLAVPNVSEGRDEQRIARFLEVLRATGVSVLDVHSDASHNRSVFTLTGTRHELVAGCTELASAATEIDLRTHEGVHPRLGGLDVCPFVPYQEALAIAVEVARATAERIGREAGLPVFLYGDAARRETTRELPDLRRGGISTLAERARTGLPPDEGPGEIDPTRGVVCVGARGPLIAFNVWVDAELDTTRALAREVRSPSLRALGLPVGDAKTQVSMNLIEPQTLGIEDAFGAVEAAAERHGVQIAATEIVGLVERRFLPSPDATVTRLLLEPGHCLEERLARN